MDLNLKEEFLKKWNHYFGSAELPIVYFYRRDHGQVPVAKPPKGWSCIICELAEVRKGKSLAYNEPVIRCGGAQRYLGYAKGWRPDFEYFLSCGIPGKMEGERYIRTPEMVREVMKNIKDIPAENDYIIFKRWDQLDNEDEPVAVIFFATPNVLSGLFTLANFDRVEGDGVKAPFGSGCGSIIYQSYWEEQKEDPRAILGMFDPSARPCVPGNILTFSIPMKKFVKMVGNMDESFLITETWDNIRKHL